MNHLRTIKCMKYINIHAGKFSGQPTQFIDIADVLFMPSVLPGFADVLLEPEDFQ